MKKLLLLAASLGLAACSDMTPTSPAINGPAFAKSAAPGQTKLRCFSGPSEGTVYGGSCTLGPGGVNATSAVLDNTGGDPDGSYSGIYVLYGNLSGQTLAGITQLSYSYTGTVTPTPGALSYNLPIDVDQNGTTEFYAYVDAAYCPGVNGVVDIITDSSCEFYAGNTSFPNWQAFLAAYPSARVATDHSVIIVAETAAKWTVSNIKLGQASR